MSIDELFRVLWEDYVEVTPQAEKIHALLAARGDSIVNDHIALRTFGVEGVHIEDLDREFVEAGYQPAQSYSFPDKKLVACHYEHPSRPLPKVFISELEVNQCSPRLQQIVAELVRELPPGAAVQPQFSTSGRIWPVTKAIYDELASESEYAAWVAAYGFRANHFTVDVNKLESFDSLEAVNAFLEAEGFSLNASGGKIKGSPADYLEQSSTMADAFEVPFDDGAYPVPSCYYEFARRYPLPDGTLFQGFVAGSADKLFESTDRER